ncbi:hypothetical protein [Pseudobacter ginsenosidimutans]|uniref:Uncharacterized protein n=1 Tax=Pseudobacter ginsenosidimutans TaxID=661488 RepID=A0A4Q7MYW9_9BACT|nr:hypothetical protein [Pseudobacter ginsenosidimutans]QEC40845.1 hypothetical protein FSB84_03715 [Pseudobacter ginsenosidimutans]RZS72423.1 hypothetical protein EV199_4344 [Pseudobacter ginsenosidimutans]
MKWYFLFVLLGLTIDHAVGQTKTYDIVTYESLTGWKEKKSESNILYSKIEGSNWAQIAIYRHTASSGDAQTDFDKDWQELIAKPFQLKTAMNKSAQEMPGGWKMISGSGVWQHNGANVATVLTTFSNKQVCVSVLCNATAKPFLDEFAQFIATMGTTYNTSQPVSQSSEAAQQQSITSSKPLNTVYKFNETKFDDGWISTIQQDWVEVAKGSMKVLIHYPNEKTVFPADPQILTNTVWDILIKPRFKDLKNYKTSYVQDYSRPYFGTGHATEIQSGRQYFVVLFRRGNGWLEVLSPDNQTFVQEFGFDPESIRWAVMNYSGGYVVNNSQGQMVKADAEVFDKLDKMSNYNKFAVALSDLNNTGEWNSHFASNSFYYNSNTGNYAGMSTITSSEWFVFGKGQTYTWNLVGANSGMGQTGVVQVKGKGSLKSLNNWQLFFSDISGKPKTCDVYFSAMKNGRVLFMNDANYPGSGIFTGFKRKN